MDSLIWSRQQVHGAALLPPCAADAEPEAGDLASGRGLGGAELRAVCVGSRWVAVLVHTSPPGLPSVREAGAIPWGRFGFACTL